MIIIDRIVSFIMGSFLSSSNSVPSLSLEEIVTSTSNNYQGRYEKFSTWAEKDENANPAKLCRTLLLEALENDDDIECSNNNDKNFISPIRLLDAGCGSGRDLQAFAKTLIRNKNRSIAPYGFDCCPGFVDVCQKQKGLSNVIQADFKTYFDKLKENENLQNQPNNNNNNNADDENNDVVASTTIRENDYNSKNRNDTTSNNSTLPSSATALPPAVKVFQFHCIFSLAALFHIPRDELKFVLEIFYQHLKSNGYLLISLPCNGNRNELGKDGRWMHSMPKKEQLKLLKTIGFTVLTTKTISQYNGNHWFVTLSKKQAESTT